MGLTDKVFGVWWFLMIKKSVVDVTFRFTIFKEESDLVVLDEMDYELH